MNKNSKQPLQFTKLSIGDIRGHRENYILLLINTDKRIAEKGVEMMRTDKRFYDTFK